MHRSMIFLAFLAAVLPLTAGTIMPCGAPLVCRLDANNPTPMDVGAYMAGTELIINVTGTINLNGPNGDIITNPDGSLSNPAPMSCSICWFGIPGYTYFLENSNAYPTIDGGDGTNHFVGGGGNFDAFPGDHAAFALEGAQTTDTSDPNAIRFGAVAYTFLANPGPTDWHLLGYGGSITVPQGAADLRLIVVDTYYPNNTGQFVVEVNPAPEPVSMGLAFSGLLLLGGARRWCARRRR